MELRYTHDHQWVRHDGSAPAMPMQVTVGLSDFAQQELGEIAHLDLPRVGARVERGQVVCAIESLKSASELYAPATGVVVAANRDLTTAAGRTLINRDPLGAGWIFRLELADPAELEQLLSARDYARMTASEP